MRNGILYFLQVPQWCWCCWSWLYFDNGLEGPIISSVVKANVGHHTSFWTKSETIIHILSVFYIINNTLLCYLCYFYVIFVFGLLLSGLDVFVSCLCSRKVMKYNLQNKMGDLSFPKRTHRYRKLWGSFETQRSWVRILVLVTSQVALGKPHVFWTSNFYLSSRDSNNS